jgi:uncharacterized Zn finger protein (UPF0148 family)
MPTSTCIRCGGNNWGKKSTGYRYCKTCNSKRTSVVYSSLTKDQKKALRQAKAQRLRPETKKTIRQQRAERDRRPEPNTGCLLWTGSVIEDGYGRLSVDGKLELVHRAVWIVRHGPLPDGVKVLHKCDTPSCAEDSHLFTGSQADNVRDMIAKGRYRHPRSRAA